MFFRSYSRPAGVSEVSCSKNSLKLGSTVRTGRALSAFPFPLVLDGRSGPFPTNGTGVMLARHIRALPGFPQSIEPKQTGQYTALYWTLSRARPSSLTARKDGVTGV